MTNKGKENYASGGANLLHHVVEVKTIQDLNEVNAMINEGHWVVVQVYYSPGASSETSSVSFRMGRLGAMSIRNMIHDKRKSNNF